MTDPQVTQLSALIDGELTSNNAGSLYATLGCDPALRATWERYHLIGQVLRGEPVRPEVRTVAAAVRRQTAAVALLPPPRAAALRLWRTPFVGAALAAAAAFVAVFVVPGLYRELAPNRPPPPLAVTPKPIPAVRRWETDRADLVSKLDRFLVNHQEAAPGSGTKGMLPYATLVGYEAQR